ncbi:hypothetical protein ES703_58065 [subsurface metagenome]
MARLTCPKCGHEWVRQVKASRGQAIRCPSCKRAIGRMSKQLKPRIPQERIKGKAITEYG